MPLLTCNSWLVTLDMSLLTPHYQHVNQSWHVTLSTFLSWHVTLDKSLSPWYTSNATLNMSLSGYVTIEMSLSTCHVQMPFLTCHSRSVTLGRSLSTFHFQPITLIISHLTYHSLPVTLNMSLSTNHSWNITLDLGLLTCHSWHMYIIFLEILKDFEIWKFFVRHSLTDSHLRDLEELSLLKMLQHGL